MKKAIALTPTLVYIRTQNCSKYEDQSNKLKAKTNRAKRKYVSKIGYGICNCNGAYHY